MRVQVGLLGAFRVVVEDRVIAPGAWRRERGAALVKLLALSTGHRLHREQAMEALWPDMAPDASAANLRKAVHYARRALGEHDLIGVEHDVVVLAPNAQLVIDAEAFEAAAQSALRAPAPDAAACARAADQYGGELLPDDRYVAWVEQPRERLRQLYARVLKAARLWERLLVVEPADEEAQRALMQAALDAGNRGEVVRLFQRLRERLRIDLGVGPAAATVAIYQRAIDGAAPQPIDITDRVRASLAWGLIHLQSGEFAKAEQIAREARLLAIEGTLAREVGEASALYGLTAHMQGRWPDLFRTEFIEWIRSSPQFAPTVFDGHLCLAEFCLCGAGGHEDLAKATRELLAIATDAASTAGRALATLILGEADLFSGELDAADASLSAAERLYEEMDETAGRVIVLQRLAEVALARGQKYRAGRVLQKAWRKAESSWLSPHLLLRLQALAVETAGPGARATEAIQRGDRWLAERSMCQPCSMGFRVASAIALAQAGELAQASRRLDEAERLAGMWNGGPWVAAVWEGRGVQRRAQGQTDQAAGLFREAAARYAALGRRRDQERCLARAGGAA
ncbi:MAG TPA: BTAD domain-containing putative transcriptional regulator [Gemmatimonadales bacterium]|nr:BTAD domain-containing putative transcriptional regulator [Gemmatimonadales bacterium]